MDKISGQDAKRVIDQAGSVLNKVPGGDKAMGLGPEGPKKGGLFAAAQGQGGVSKGSKGANVQSNAMKK